MQELVQQILQDQIKGKLNKQISNSLGVSDDKAQDLIENSLPYLLGGLKKNTASETGKQSLLKALESGKHDEAVLTDPLSSTEGEKVLKHVLGDQEETIEAQIAKDTEVDPAQAKKTLAVMAPLVMAALSKVVKVDKLNADKLSDIVGDLSKNKDFMGTGKKLAMELLDKDGDGDIKDDFIGLAQKWISRQFSKK